MLRIRTGSTADESGQTITQNPAQGIPTPNAGHDAGIEAPSVANRERPQDATGETLEGNHGAAILPWLTAEIRFHTVLDMGCGDGEAVATLSENGFEAHGIDIEADPSSGIANVRRGDMLETAHEDGYFDCVICCNVFDELSGRQISTALEEMDRLSNSYVMITTASEEGAAENDGHGTARSAEWWTRRIADVGWRFRLLREDPETGQLAMLCEKPDSLAAKILPLIDSGELDPNGTPPAPASSEFAEITAILDDAVALFDANDRDSEAYGRISDLAKALMDLGVPLTEIHPVFNEIVQAMERQDRDRLRTLLVEQLRPALT